MMLWTFECGDEWKFVSLPNSWWKKSSIKGTAKMKTCGGVLGEVDLRLGRWGDFWSLNHRSHDGNIRLHEIEKKKVRVRDSCQIRQKGSLCTLFDVESGERGVTITFSLRGGKVVSAGRNQSKKKKKKLTKEKIVRGEIVGGVRWDSREMEKSQKNSFARCCCVISYIWWKPSAYTHKSNRIAARKKNKQNQKNKRKQNKNEKEQQRANLIFTSILRLFMVVETVVALPIARLLPGTGTKGKSCKSDRHQNRDEEGFRDVG